MAIVQKNAKDLVIVMAIVQTNAKHLVIVMAIVQKEKDTQKNKIVFN